MGRLRTRVWPELCFGSSPARTPYEYLCLRPSAGPCFDPLLMDVSGVWIDEQLRAAKARLRGDASAENAARVAALLARRDDYRSCVHARFSLDTYRQTSLSEAIHYAKLTRAPRRSRLRYEIRDARRIKLTLEGL